MKLPRSVQRSFRNQKFNANDIVIRSEVIVIGVIVKFTVSGPSDPKYAPIL